MEDNKLAARIRPLEAFAAANPGGYRFRVALVALLGYGYLLLIVTLLLALVAILALYTRVNFVTIKIIWIPLVLVWLVLRAFWITIPEPDGKELQREQAPALFDLIHEVSDKLEGPKVHHVFISDEVNASIIQIPQFGMFGRLRNYIVVGLPLLRALTPDEFRAVLAHEFGHLSGKHGRFTGWIYRVRQTWIQILTQVHQDRSYASFLFEPFLNWYAPYLNAYSFVLARTQEREADAYAVDFAGKEFAAMALIRITTKDRVLSEVFWPTFLNGAKEQSRVPQDTFTQMLSGLDQPIGHAKAQKWFLDELRVKTDYEDTHPSLGDRLTAIGFQKDGPELTNLVNAMVQADEAPESAASRYLRELPEEFEPSMNRLWREQIAHAWSDRHEGFKRAAKRLNEIEEHAKTRELTVEEQWERIVAIAQVQNWEAALPAVRTFLNDHPDHVDANFALGSYLLEHGDKEGVERLEKATATGAELAGDACQRIAGFYFEQGDHEKVEIFRKRAEEYFDQARRIQQQVFSFSVNDKFEPHGLEEERVKELKFQLEKVRGLESAYLFRKPLDGPANPSLYILAFTTQPTWWNGENARHPNVVVEDLSAKVSIPTPSMMISLDGQWSIIYRINGIPGAQLFAVPDHGVTYRN
jgi:Zn-dependent protease with chaperone function